MKPWNINSRDDVLLKMKKNEVILIIYQIIIFIVFLDN